MFTVEDRARLRAELLADAAADVRLSGAAITGSGAAGREDRWSDVDLAFGVRDGAAVAEVLDAWSARMYGRYGAVDHVDVQAGAWIYRVFLLRSTLQVDLAFAPAAEFRPLGPAFRLITGAAGEAALAPAAHPGWLAGMAWLYALHARSALARGKRWQAEYMISGVRDYALALACTRYGLATAHGRGIDELPAEVTSTFEAALVRGLDREELARAFHAAMDALMGELRAADPALAERLKQTLLEIAAEL